MKNNILILILIGIAAIAAVTIGGYFIGRIATRAPIPEENDIPLFFDETMENGIMEDTESISEPDVPPAEGGPRMLPTIPPHELPQQ